MTESDPGPSEDHPDPAEGMTLVLLADPAVPRRVVPRLFATSVPEHLARAALGAGFSRVVVGPGVRAIPEGAEETCTMDPVGGPALCCYDTVYVRRGLLSLMVEHPLEPGERFTVYDVAGRPAALFCGDLAAVPEELDPAPGLDLPEELGEEVAIRVMTEEDLPPSEDLLLRDVDVADRLASPWEVRVVRPLVRLLSRTGPRVERLDLAALVLAAGAGLLPMVPGWFGPVLGALSLLAAVVVQRTLAPLRAVHGVPPPKDRVDAAIRSIGHAAFTSGMTYRLVADEARPTVASFVVLVVGVVAAGLSLLRAREYLLGRDDGPLALQRAEGWIRRMGVEPAAWWKGLPALELLALALACTAVATLPWLTFVLASAARLWRYFVTAERLLPPLASPTPSDRARGDRPRPAAATADRRGDDTAGERASSAPEGSP